MLQVGALLSALIFTGQLVPHMLMDKLGRQSLAQPELYKGIGLAVILNVREVLIMQDEDRIPSPTSWAQGDLAAAVAAAQACLPAIFSGTMSFLAAPDLVSSPSRVHLWCLEFAGWVLGIQKNCWRTLGLACWSMLNS